MFRFEKRGYIPFLPGEKIRIAFLFQVASFWPSWESFYDASLVDERFDVKLILLNRSSVEKAATKTANDFLKNKGLNYFLFDDFDFDSFKPHVAVFQSPYDTYQRVPEGMSINFLKRGIRVVYVPYGLEIADTEDARRVHFNSFTVINSWRIYVLSDSMCNEYFQHCPNRHAIRVTGHPKFDSYFDKNKFQLPVNLKMQVNNRKIVLWKVHFPKIIHEGSKSLTVTPDWNEYIYFAEKLSQYSDLFFIYMPHPIILNGGVLPEFSEKTGRVSDILHNLENVYIDSSDDYRPSLLNCDAIITDRSALMIEAAVTGVPILYMYNKEYDEPITEPLIPLMDSYCKGTSAQDMFDFLDMFRAGGDPGREQRIIALDQCIPYIDGKCGERIKDDIANSIVHEARKENNKTKLALFSTGKIFDYYWNETGLFDKNKYDIVAISDNNPAKWGDEIDGVKVIEPSELKRLEFDFIVITTEQYFSEIMRQLVFDINICSEKILRLDYFVYTALNEETL